MGRPKGTGRGWTGLLLLAVSAVTLACGGQTRVTPETAAPVDPVPPATPSSHEATTVSPSQSSVDQIRVVPIPAQPNESNIRLDVSPLDGSPMVVAESYEGSRSALPVEPLRVTVRRWHWDHPLVEGAFTGGEYLVLSYGNQGLSLSRLSSDGALVQETQFPGTTRGSVSPQGAVVMTPGGRVQVVNPQGVEVLSYEALAEDPPGTRLDSVVLGPRRDGVVEFVGQENQDAIRVRFRRLDHLQVVWQREAGYYPNVKFSPDGTLVELWAKGVDGPSEEHIQVYKTDGTEVGRINLSSIENSATWFDGDEVLAPDNRHLAMVDVKKKVWFFDIATGAVVRTWEPSVPDLSYRRVKAAFSPDQTTLYITEGMMSR